METFIEMVEFGMLIIEGWAKWGIDSIRGRISETARKRLETCENCPFSSHGVCKRCGCVIKAKVRVDFKLDKDGKSIDGCPENRW